MFRNRNALFFTNIEDEFLTQLYYNQNRGENYAVFASRRLPDTHADAIAIRQVCQELTIQFDVNKEGLGKKNGHPSWLSINNRPTGPISYEAIVRAPSRADVRQHLERTLTSTHEFTKFRYFIGLNLFEHPSIEEFGVYRPLKNMRKRLSNKEAQLLLFFCHQRCHLLRSDIFYASFCHMNTDALNVAATNMSLWLASEEGIQVCSNLRRNKYIEQYLEPLFRLLASSFAEANHVDIDRVGVWP